MKNKNDIQKAQATSTPRATENPCGVKDSSSLGERNPQARQGQIIHIKKKNRGTLLNTLPMNGTTANNPKKTISTHAQLGIFLLRVMILNRTYYPTQFTHF